MFMIVREEKQYSLFGSAGWANSIGGQKLAVCVCVC